MDKKKLYLIGLAICLGAIAPLPYGFYTFVRITVTIIGVVAALDFYKNQDGIWILFGGIALIFNPIIPIYLNREIWFFIDLIVAGAFGYAAFKRRNY